MGETPDLTRWLGLTNQQFSIIEAMLQLQKEDKSCTPNNIIQKDSELRQAPTIQKSNFFSQLKKLRDKGYVKKVSNANYDIDLDSVKHSLDLAEYKISDELDEVKKAREQTENYLRTISSPEGNLSVSFFEASETYERFAEMLKSSYAFDCTGVFPRILYAESLSLMHRPETQKYAQKLWERCMKDRDLNVRYLSNFNISYLFQKFLDAYNDADMAYDEIRKILEKLPKELEKNPKLNIYFMESHTGLDAIIPHNRGSDEFFLLIRNEVGDMVGSVYINSPGLKIRFNKIFKDECERAVDLRSKKGTQIIKRLQGRLDRVYNKNKKRS